MPPISIPGGQLRDPLQGFDIQVSVRATGGVSGDVVLQGAFTGFMCRIQVQTEAYLALNQRVPRMLDGLIIASWMLEQGMQSNKPVAETFGKPFAVGFAKGRTVGNAIPRTRRFLIDMETSAAAIPDTIDESTFWTTLENSDTAADPASLKKLVLTAHYARIDNGNFGVVAGGRVASSSWQGTAQHVSVKF